MTFDLYKHTFRDSKTYGQKGEITYHYAIEREGVTPDANYKYHLNTEHIGRMTSDEIYNSGEEIDRLAFRKKYNLDPHIPFGMEDDFCS